MVQHLSGQFSQLLLPARPQIRIGDQVQTGQSSYTQHTTCYDKTQHAPAKLDK
jgi:hypothetical protein